MNSHPLRRRRTVNVKGTPGARSEQASQSDSFAPRAKRDVGTCSAHKRPRTRAWALAFALSLLVALPVAASGAESEVTRESYVASVEPICKTNKQASDRYLTGVRKLVKDDKLKKAAENFTKAAAALEKAQKQLSLVPQPTADEAKLVKWLAGIKGEVSLMRRIAAKLRAGNAGKASSLSVKLTHDATTTNNQVIVFQFNYCKIDPAQYT